MACHENEVDASRETSHADIRECGKDRGHICKFDSIWVIQNKFVFGIDFPTEINFQFFFIPCLSRTMNASIHLINDFLHVVVNTPLEFAVFDPLLFTYIPIEINVGVAYIVNLPGYAILVIATSHGPSSSMEVGRHVLNEARVFDGYTSKEALEESVIVKDSLMVPPATLLDQKHKRLMVD